jgi:hypothetical protein
LNSVVSSNSLGTTIWKLHFGLIIPNYGDIDTRIAVTMFVNDKNKNVKNKMAR